MKTSDKVGLVACIVLAIIVTIFVLWPRHGKAAPPPAPKTIGQNKAAGVDEKGISVAGAATSPDGAPRDTVSLSAAPTPEAPATSTPPVTFYDPGAPPVIE